ncbi:type I restriction enzyme HsdR N-terminal domain-containing protein [uncultured Proteiniphilum sp.]|uniref:type I restriction enzyme HsdR N-terminal domain-containing protein n=1 Tax=uncultured Proteiniphilum sp. TaxID=497637 RepID=UPI00261551D9|nr:type I restriction enzyme HsdR N-terminal domain-containing protein [uncultured Proteiniphilum sp.]
MCDLNLPSFDTKIRKKGDGVEIFDPLRRKYVRLTPEEWVRQHFVHYLISEKSFPASLIANETGIKLNSLARRCDTVVYNRQLEPVMIVEYKSPDVIITQQVFDQVTRYNSVLKVPYIVVSNGMKHHCCRIDYERQSYRYLIEIPAYNELESID